MPDVLTALDVHNQIKRGERKAVDVLAETLDVIHKTEPRLNAFNLIMETLAYDTAKDVDRLIAEGKGEELPLLAGVPIAVKDNINIEGFPTTCSSKILDNYVSPYNATVYDKLKAHLMPVVGKTNMDEFAMGSSTENSAFKPTKNPWNLECVPGGSSGGSAACVSAGQAFLSLGSDTGGSVRQPASLCGIYGLKPTYGLVSRYGLVAFASSLDQISPFARNAHDTAALLQVISGWDPMDSTSIHPKPKTDYFRDIEMGIQGLRIGIIAELDGQGMQPEVQSSFQEALELLRKLGATVQTLSLPSIRQSVASYYILATAEASSNLARFDGVRYGYRSKNEGNILSMYRQTRAEGFGPEVKRRIMLGTYCLSSGYYEAYYGKAQKARRLMRMQFDEAWKSVDVLLCPTSPTTAFKIGEKVDDPVSMYLSDIATIPANLVGIPGLSIPCGFDTQGLPIGLQVLGPHLSEALLLRVARTFERETPYSNLQPKFG